jgi:LysM repeat protein
MTNQFEKITVSRAQYKMEVTAARRAEARTQAFHVLKKPVWIVTIALGVTVGSLSIEHFIKPAEAATTSQQQNVQEIQFEYNESYVYTIKPGDTVESLAKSHGVSVQQVRDYNALTSDKLVPGTTIDLPDLNNPYNEGSPLHKYVAKNNQQPVKQTEQPTVKTPVTKETVKPVTKSVSKPVTQAPTKPANYKVQGGETLFKIAKKFNVSVDALKKANNLTSDNLYVGQGLYVPLKAVSSTTVKQASKPAVQKPTLTPVKQTPTRSVSTTGSYVVKSGDNLWKIARNHSVTVEALKQANHLTTNTLYIGEKLVIPGKSVSANTSTHVSAPKTKEQVATKETTVSSIGYAVQPGDTIWTLSQRFGISKEKIKRDNGLKTDAIIISQTIKLKDINIQQVSGIVIGAYDKDDKNFIALNVNGKTKVIRVSFKQTPFFDRISGEKIVLRYVPKSNSVKDDAFVNFNFAK